MDAFSIDFCWPTKKRPENDQKTTRKQPENAFCSVITGAVCSERMQDAKTNLSANADVLAELGGKQIPEPWSPFSCEAADITFDDRYAFRVCIPGTGM